MKVLLLLILCIIVLNPSNTCADYISDYFEFHLQPENAETKQQFSRRYIGREHADSIFIYDTVLGKTIWKIEKGPTTHGHVIFLAIGPNIHYAVISHEFGEQGQKLYWVDLTKGGFDGHGIAIDPEALRELVAKTINSHEEWLSQVYFIAQKWLTDNTCVLSWDCTGGEHDLHYAGVILLSVNSQVSQSPIITMGKHTAGMSDEKWWKFDSSTLYKE